MLSEEDLPYPKHYSPRSEHHGPKAPRPEHERRDRPRYEQDRGCQAKHSRTRWVSPSPQSLIIMPPTRARCELRRIPLPRTRLLRPLDPSSGVPHRLGRLRPVAHPQNLVGGAQMLLDHRLRQVQAPGYLGVAQALHGQFQDLSLTGREVPDFGLLVLAQEVA